MFVLEMSSSTPPEEQIHHFQPNDAIAVHEVSLLYLIHCGAMCKKLYTFL